MGIWDVTHQAMAAFPGNIIYPLEEPKLFREPGLSGVLDSEEGIFLIIASDGTQYLPSSLPKKYAIDGLNVEFKAYKMPINPTVRMRGTPIRIISITPASQRKGKLKPLVR